MRDGLKLENRGSNGAAGLESPMRLRHLRERVASAYVGDSEPTAVSEARKRLVEEFSRMDDFAVAMGEGIGILLEPWLSGSTPLDYVTVTQVMKWVLEGMKSQHQLEQFEALRRRHATGAEEGT